MIRLFLAIAFVISAQAHAEGGLENKLGALDMSEASVPQSVAREKFYSIQPRAVDLKYRTELGLGFGSNLTGNSFLQSDQVSASVQFHFNDRWSAAVGRNQVYNRFSSVVGQLSEDQGMLPDVAFASDRTEARVEYNLFYGKFRFTREQTLYFDFFVGGGWAQHNLNTGRADGPLADAGLAFWFPKASFRLGFKDYYYSETRMLKAEANHNVHAYSSVAYLF